MAMGSVMIATSAERTCQRKTRQTSATTMLSSMSFSRSVCDGVVDQFAAVVGRDDAHAFGQRGFDFLQLLLDAVDDVQRVLAVAHDDDAADRFALAVEFRDAAPQVRAEMHGADILHIDRRAVHDLEHDVLDVRDAS